jgi:hypothetical protein
MAACQAPTTRSLGSALAYSCVFFQPHQCSVQIITTLSSTVRKRKEDKYEQSDHTWAFAISWPAKPVLWAVTAFWPSSTSEAYVQEYGIVHPHSGRTTGSGTRIPGFFRHQRISNVKAASTGLLHVKRVGSLRLLCMPRQDQLASLNLSSNSEDVLQAKQS